jgi:Uma2 family endonuclease
MVTVTLLPQSRALTSADLESLPDDGHRYELLDGTLIVTPAPSWLHQRVVSRIARQLEASCPPDMEVFFAPFDVTIALDTVLQPDVLVARRDALDDHGLTTAPVLAVEVLSPSTRHIDLSLKRSRYEVAGCPSYWVVDPEKPSLLAWELRGGSYVLVADVTGGASFTASSPYDVTVSPAALVA